MLLSLSRYKLTAKETLGVLCIDGAAFCRSLEDVVRKGPKVAHETAIPAGTYNVVISPSPRFKRQMMRLEDVPGFTGILIHGGNTSEDTWGCILVGYSIDPENHIKAGTSQVALVLLFAKVQAALIRGDKVTITITDDFPEAPHE